jgi:hypothetical protein
MVSSEGTCAAFFSAGRGLGGLRTLTPAMPLIQAAPIVPAPVPGAAEAFR